MTYDFFNSEMRRVKGYFRNGEQVYNRDRMGLIWPVVKDLPPLNFQKIVDLFIGENSPDWPPRVSDFREKTAEQQRILFQEECRRANLTFQKEAPKRADGDGLKQVLEDMGVKSLVEAINKKKTTTQGA